MALEVRKVFMMRMAGSIFIIIIFFITATLGSSYSDCSVPNPVLAIPSTDLEEPWEILDDGGLENGTALLRLRSEGATLPQGNISSESARNGAAGYNLITGQYSALLAIRAEPDKAEDVVFSVWVRSIKGDAEVRPFISFEDGNGAVVKNDYGDYVKITEEWSVVDFTSSSTSAFLFALAGIEIPSNSEVDIDDFSVKVPVWKEAEVVGGYETVGTVDVPFEPVAPVMLRFSIHIEDPQELVTDEAYFLRKTAVMKELARIFHDHGGFLNIQPELEWAIGAKRYGPDTLKDLAEQYGATYSTHTHGPVCVDSSGHPFGSAYCNDHQELSRDVTSTDVAEYVAERRETLEEMSGTKVIDHNGNFDLEEKDILYEEGIRIISGFKNHFTQRTYDYFIMNPWRPSNSNALEDIDSFITNDPSRKLVYMPGVGHTVTRHHFRVREKVRRFASNFINNADASSVNTMNLIFHADSFTSVNGLSQDEYIKVVGSGNDVELICSEEFLEHLAYWEDMLEYVIDPLVENGYLKWANQHEMLEAFSDWESECNSIVNTDQTVLVSARVPSVAAGMEGLAVNIRVPAVARYASGAPVLIDVVGGTEGSGISSNIKGCDQQGFIEISFNFPGSGVMEEESGGTYDYRGEDSVKALRDVALFAMGGLQDMEGKTLAELAAPVVPLYHNVGMAGLSNGGNTAICAAGIYVEDLKGLAWLVNWESPVGDGMPTGEAGAQKGVDGQNPAFNPAYDPDTGVWDLGLLEYDSQMDINLNHTSNIPLAMNGGLYFDINENRSLDEGVDFVIYPFTLPDLSESSDGTSLAFFSERVTEYAFDNGIYPLNRPDHIVSFEECADFWYWRNGEKWINTLVENNPELMFLVVASEEDHVQTALDHPHVLIQYELFRDSGAHFTRLNPDRSYMELITPGDYISDVSDHDAGKYFDHITIRTALEPDTVEMAGSVLAGCCELADRTQIDNNDKQISLAAKGFKNDPDSTITLECNKGDNCLLLTPFIPEGYDLYAGIMTPSDNFFLLVALNSLEFFDLELPEWQGGAVMLDFQVADEIPSGDYTIYTLFTPSGKDPLELPEGYVLSERILTIKD